MISYKIIDGAVYLYDGDNPIPFLYQPRWPNGQEWADGEAEPWAKQAILAITDPDADEAGDSPDQPTKPKIVHEVQDLPTDQQEPPTE